MAKGKSKGSVPNKHLHSRLAYLQQAAIYLTAQARKPDLGAVGDNQVDGRIALREASQFSTSGGLPSYYASHIRQIAHKAVIRLPRDVKNSICRKCSTALIEGQTCTTRSENRSRDASKPWAEVLIYTCKTCGATKRFPISAKRQQKKATRLATKEGSLERGLHADRTSED
ncbi:Rpr2-domain-containing protein [Teratosphaeria nubilosa]|uniref:Rpr2-domain-containing protein n=1 Tax=Teratosphaeria nubilosa TaxID=161662 RepID=A0A6G1LA80_9PEZI|nr:Rpr2-domain-containing protein [Teratosphaeria nubilosa]